MRSKKKEAKFFCESCGNEVPKNAKVCPTCGKFFAAVRCPKCGRTGSNDDFLNGCPTCGYAVNPDSRKRNSSSAINLLGSVNSNIKYKNTNQIWRTNNKTRHVHKKWRYVESSLPLWMYISSVMVLGVLVTMLYSCLK